MVGIGYHRGPRLMSSLRKLWVRLRNPHTEIRFGKSTLLGPRFNLYAPWGGTFIVGSGVSFGRNFRCELSPGSRVTIAEGATFADDVVIQCGTTIDFGERVTVGQCSLVVDGNHRFRDLDRPMLAQGYDFRPLRIDDDATVGSKCTVINDVGRRAVVEANSVVSQPVPADSVATGLPARVHERVER